MTLDDALRRYMEAFGEYPPLAAWAGDDDHLVAVLEGAMRAGTPLVEADILKAAGLTVPEAPGDEPVLY